MKETYLTRKDNVGSSPFDSIQWAFEVHLKQPDTGYYNCAVLYGNEDCPSQIDFWRKENPSWIKLPDFTWKRPVEIE